MSASERRPGGRGRPTDPLLATLLDVGARRPATPLLITAGRTYGYGDFLAAAGGVVALLRERDLRPGERVVLFTDAYDTFFIAMIGVWLAGGVAVPINTTLPAAAAADLIARSRPRLVLCDAGGTPPAGQTPTLTIDPQALPAAPPPPYTPVPSDALAMILFTSGTTGVPKGVCQRLSAVTGNARRVAAALGLRPDDRIFINTPAFYTSGICHFLTLAAAGGSTVGEAGFFFGEALLEELTARGCSGFGGAPAHLVRVVDPMTAPQRIPGLRFWVSSGDHLPAATIARMSEFLPDVSLFNMYGLTEVSGRLCVLPPEQIERRRGSVGRPLPNMHVTARDPQGAALAPGEVGELYVDGPLVMLEYLDDPAATAAALGPHGFRTGDFGSVDQEGFVWVEGRKDDIFKRGGEKVSTVQIQQALLALDEVADCAVLAIEDGVLGHVPVAFVAPHGGQRPRGGHLLRLLRERLPASALPSRILIVEAIPRTGSGKAVRAELLALLGSSRA